MNEKNKRKKLKITKIEIRVYIITNFKETIKKQGNTVKNCISTN